jgi:hypothetical protein
VPPENNAYGGGVGETVLGTGVLILMLIIIGLILLAPRKYLVSVLLTGLFLLPVGETLVIGGFHVFVTRILVLTGLIRAVVSRPPEKHLLAGKFNLIDKIFIVGTIYRAMAFVLTFREMGAVVREFGFLWDALGGYFLMRMLIRKDVDILRVFKTLAVIVSFLGITMLYEHQTRVNVFGFIAGHPIIPEVRSGGVRAQGPFHHAILAGVFSATIWPLLLWLFTSGKAKILAVAGLIGSTLAVFSAGSSTTVSAYLAGFLAICFWPIRKNMRIIRSGLVLAIIALNFAMSAPVWWALEHVDFAGGSAGEHRAELIDNLVRHFGDWWLIGTKDNANWGFEMWDTSNQFIDDAETGGLVCLICIIAVLTLAYKRIGKARRLVQGDRQKEWYFWILGSALFCHMVAFFGISYFDQTRFSWYALLATIIVATAPGFARKSAPESSHATVSVDSTAGSLYVAEGLLAGRTNWE